jgi:molecular chaperone HtpG
MKAIWLRSESEVSEEEYETFYSHLAHFGSKPFKRICFSAEGKSEFKALLFLPSAMPPDFLFNQGDALKGVHLYIRRVFISDDCPGLLPKYLSFVKGVVDSSDLPLNISRETLQDNPHIALINKNLVRRLLSEFKDCLEKDRENYEKFYKEFSRFLKEGTHSDFANKEKLQDLLLFETLRNPAGKLVSLKEYVDAMPAGQKEIYCIAGDSRDGLANSPHLELFKSKGYDVIPSDDRFDEWVVESIREYLGQASQVVAKGKSNSTRVPEGARREDRQGRGGKRSCSPRSRTPSRTRSRRPIPPRASPKRLLPVSTDEFDPRRSCSAS